MNTLLPDLPDSLHVLRIGCGGDGVPGLEDGGHGKLTLPLEHVPVSESDVALQIYTSGISGRPRGALLSHANLMADVDSLFDHCLRNMAPFKVSQAIEFTSSLPRNSAGKVLKAKLKERMVRGDVTPRTPRP